jgi:hypothetical protein
MAAALTKHLLSRFNIRLNIKLSIIVSTFCNELHKKAL